MTPFPDLAPTTPPCPESDPYDAYWHLVATGTPHRWIALTTDWRVADHLMRRGVILLPGWPLAPAVDWLNGPYAADWWLPAHGRRILITASTDADAHLATLVMPVIERHKPARLVFRNYRPVEEVTPQPATLTTAPASPARSTNELGHAAAA